MFVKLIFDIGQNVFRVLSQSFHHCCQNYVLWVERKFLRRFFFGKNLFFSSFYLRRNVFWFLTTFLWHDCHNCMVRARRNTLRKNIFFSTELAWLSYSPISGRTFLKFGRKVLAGLSKQPPTYPEKHFDRIIFSDTFIHYLFLGSGRTYFRLSPKFWERLPKLRFSCPEQFFW